MVTEVLVILLALHKNTKTLMPNIVIMLIFTRQYIPHMYIYIYIYSGPLCYSSMSFIWRFHSIPMSYVHTKCRIVHFLNVRRGNFNLDHASEIEANDTHLNVTIVFTHSVSFTLK